MERETATRLLCEIVARERADGCTMADEALIEPTLRRWQSYDRRFLRHRNKSLAHRAHDLEKGLLKLHPDYSYDLGCIRHLAQSFATALYSGRIDDAAASNHADQSDA